MADAQDLNPWLVGTGVRGDAYDERFEELSRSGINVHGEADFVGSLGVRSVLDGGCGTGRVAIELGRRGLEVVGVDLDERMLETARRKGEGICFVKADLVDVHLDKEFDAVLLAGNVINFLTPGTHEAVLANLASHIRQGGVLVMGFTLHKTIELSEADEMLRRLGLGVESRFSTWDQDRHEAMSTYAVSVYRKSAQSLW